MGAGYLMTYSVKEIFYTIQGEGFHSGRPAVFCRFAGCNLWNGRESDRVASICRFCDTDFVGANGQGGGKFQSAEKLADAIDGHWPKLQRARRLVVCTGGEPLLQLDAELIGAIRGCGLELAIETNGTVPLPSRVDWLCVSPKSDSELAIRRGDELKLVFPQPDAPPERFSDLDFAHFFLQPMDGPNRDANTTAAVQYCLEHPQWRLSLQTQKAGNFR